MTSPGPAAARAGGDLLLVDGSDLAASAASASWIARHGPSFTSVTVLGGPDVVAPAVPVAAVRAAGAA
ncbi:MAG: hypothetical protein ACRD0J_13270 [Acidimicrobiales bacterium]